MKTLILITLLAIPLGAWAKSTPANIEVWCGATGTSAKNEFPYITAIKKFTNKRGASGHLAEIYKGKKVVFRQFVFKNSQHDGTSYVASGDIFNLKVPVDQNKKGESEFRAVIPDGKYGNELISNGRIQCHG